MASRRASREVNLARCSFLRLASRLFWFCGAKTGSGRGTKEFGSHPALRQTTADLGEVMGDLEPLGFLVARLVQREDILEVAPEPHRGSASRRRSVLLRAHRRGDRLVVVVVVVVDVLVRHGANVPELETKTPGPRRIVALGSPGSTGALVEYPAAGRARDAHSRASSPATRRPRALLFLASSLNRAAGERAFRAGPSSARWIGRGRGTPWTASATATAAGRPASRRNARGVAAALTTPSVPDGWMIRNRPVRRDIAPCSVRDDGPGRDAGPDGKRAAQHMAASDRFTLGVLSFLSLGTFAAIFAATQERKVERYRRQGRPLPPGSSDPGASRDSGKRGEGRGVPGGEERDDDVVGDAASRECALHGV